MYVPSVREDEALAMAAGAFIGGKAPVVLMQNSGLGTSLNTMISLNLIYLQPCLLMISWRGHDGKDDGKDDEKGKSKDEEDKGSKDGKDGEKEQTPEEKELRALGGEFARKDVAALIRRVPADVGDGKEGKVRLRLGDEDGTFGRTQAREILEKWLEARTITRVRLKSTKDLVGTFTLKFRVRGKEKEFERTLVARIARAEGDAFVLKELEVQRQ